VAAQFLSIFVIRHPANRAFNEKSEDFKIFWLVWVLVIVIGLFLNSRQERPNKWKTNYFDSIVFIIWIGHAACS